MKREKLLLFWKEKGVRYLGVAILIALLSLVWAMRSGSDAFFYTAKDGFGERGGAPQAGSDAIYAGDGDGTGGSVDEIGSSEGAPLREIICEIAGAVEEPGVYSLPEGSRVNDLIQLAGGLLESAVIDELNRAEFLSDGEKITVPTKETVGKTPVVTLSKHLKTTAGSAVFTNENENEGVSLKPALVNINTANAVALQTLKGIGPVTAEKILDYRKKAGRFTRIEDIMNVSGIGEKTFAKLKDHITVE